MQTEKERFRLFVDISDTILAEEGMTIDDLARACGISRTSIFAYRSGSQPVSSKALGKLTAYDRRRRQKDYGLPGPATTSQVMQEDGPKWDDWRRLELRVAKIESILDLLGEVLRSKSDNEKP